MRRERWRARLTPGPFEAYLRPRALRPRADLGRAAAQASLAPRSPRPSAGPARPPRSLARPPPTHPASPQASLPFGGEGLLPGRPDSWASPVDPPPPRCKTGQWPHRLTTPRAFLRRCRWLPPLSPDSLRLQGFLVPVDQRGELDADLYLLPLHRTRYTLTRAAPPAWFCNGYGYGFKLSLHARRSPTSLPLV